MSENGSEPARKGESDGARNTRNDTMAILGRDFGKALCAHFGLPLSQVARDFEVIARPDEVLAVSINIMLTPEDLAGIAKHMGYATGGPLPDGAVYIVGEPAHAEAHREARGKKP